MKLLAFAASNSKNSINRQLVVYAASLLEGAEIETLDINDYEMPIFSVDREQESGIPKAANEFFNKIGEADALLISYAEHNGSYSAAYKNLYDWASRIDAKVYQSTPMVMLATSPGGRGGASVLSTAVNSAPHFGGNVKASLAVGSFYDNFDVETGTVTNVDIQSELESAMASLC